MQRPAFLPVLAAGALSLASAAAAAESGALTAQGPDQWRASKLVGVDVLGPDGRKVGDVSDVLMDHDGHATAVVVGVGGFLGLGQKDVALPFASVHFTQDPRPGAAAEPDPGPGTAAQRTPSSAMPVTTVGAPPSAALGGPVGTSTGVPGGAATGLAAAPVGPPGGTAAPARSSARPDHATVDLTAEQLRAAPAFAFAR